MNIISSSSCSASLKTDLQTGPHSGPSLIYSALKLKRKNDDKKKLAQPFFNDLVTRLVGGDAIDADTMLRLAKEYNIDVLRVPEIARFLSNWGLDVGGQNSWELGGVEMEFLRII